MISNILYSIFFCMVDLLIYVRLQKSIQINKAFLLYLLILIVITIHFIFFESEILMNSQDFFNLFFFSAALIILHYGTNIQVTLFKKYSNLQDKSGQKLLETFIKVFDFMRQKLIYIMIFIYQFLAIWNPIYR